MDFGRNRWSASLGATSLTREQPITAAGAALTLGDIAATWIFTDPNHPGNDDMVFDNYLVTAGPSLVPRFISGLSNQTVPVGASVFLAAVPSGAAPMSCQWYYNNGQIPNATNGNLTLPNVNPAQAGNYSLIVRNASGSATNSATITVSTPPPVAQFAAPPAVLPGAGAQLNLNLSAGNNYRLLASTNLTDWTTLNSFYAAGGSITCFDPAATNYPCRFYRLVSP
jgi:PKD repeat protein